MAGTVLLPWLIDICQLENCCSECSLAPKSVAKDGFWPKADHGHAFERLRQATVPRIAHARVRSAIDPSWASGRVSSSLDLSRARLSGSRLMQ